MAGENILVVDDDDALRLVLVGLLKQAGYAARAVPSAEKALEEVGKSPIDLVVSDVRMPGMDGMALLAALGKSVPDLPVIMLSAHGTVPMAVEAMKQGAKEFMLKPFDREEVIATIERTLRACGERTSAPPPLPTASRLVGQSERMRELRELITRAAKSNATVLLRGESGCGKEVAAREIHEQSARKSGPFVPVHCGAIPETLLESELFGYEKGAFTGATKRKPGRVELAEGGTLFLDEIGDVTLAVQVKLLRLVQEREITTLGGTVPQKVDVRFVAATHRDLEAMVKSGDFREDLFYRLNVVPIWIPPLRERAGDIAELAERFTADAASRNGVKMPKLGEDAVLSLAARPWNGNVRELQSCVERLVVFADGGAIHAADVERDSARSRPLGSEPVSATSLGERREEAERRAVQEALTRAGGNRTLAARLLGVSRRTLYNKLAELGIS
ncbi:MAG TPA: sigma-54 dependent transcriptional regulator [Polyangiaceae bacterium]